MTEISQEIKNAIKGAMLLEINGRKFFNHAADVTQHERGKKMFRFLAEEEVKHLKTFSDLFSQILAHNALSQVSLQILQFSVKQLP